MSPARCLLILICLHNSALPLTAGEHERISCEAYLFEAYFSMPEDERIRKELWLMPEGMHQTFERPPLASYAFFRRLESHTWNLEVLKTLQLKSALLPRFELTFLESRSTSLGQVFYRLEYRVDNRQSARFTLDALGSAAIFLRHAKTHDEFLHLTCRPN